MSNSSTVTSDADQRIADLESKLEDTVDLLHLWKNEAYSYRHLIEAILTERYTHAEAREALARDWTLKTDGLANGCFVPLAPEEHEAVSAMAAEAGLDVSEFLWTCVDTIMCSADDPDILQGCRDAVHRRFREGKLSEWYRGNAVGRHLMSSAKKHRCSAVARLWRDK